MERSGKMKKFIVVVAVAVLVTVVSSPVTAGMWWARGDPGSTWQDWTFDDADNPAPPENYYNPGVPLASIFAQAGSHVTDPGWKPLGLGREGVWAGDVLQIELLVPNVEPLNPFKDIWLTMDYYGIVTNIGVFPNPPGAIQVLEESSVELPDLWKRYTVHWRLEPNPLDEMIVIEIINSGAYLDILSVDTICFVPEPATLMLLGLGGLLLRRKN
jgi:hypothetical protein